MSPSFPDQSFIFSLAELQRLLRSYAEKKVSRYGVTRAQWAVLAKLERTEGLPQAKLAKAMEMQPITLKRLIDPLCANGLIERRPDQSDRRAYRLYLKPAGSALVQRLKALRNEINQLALVHLAPAEALRLFSQLEAIKVNVRAALSSECEPGKKERRYG